MTISIISKTGYRKAVVGEDAEGVFINYYRTTGRGDWRFDRCARPAQPFHVALDLAQRIVDTAPPEVGARAR